MVERVSTLRASPSIPRVDSYRLMPPYHENAGIKQIEPNPPITARMGEVKSMPSGKSTKMGENAKVKEMEISRAELDAKLAQNRSETKAIADEMRREMAEFRAFQAQQFSAMSSSISEIKTQISSVSGEISGLKGQVDGLKTTSATLQWMVGAILALLAVILALPQVQSYLKPVAVTHSTPTQQK
ncbi:hypothetical protein [Cronobacter turicensis]|uniref:hypothetical protein n=1 Tax=Cronobacter turicensis TaxID=413502 RepID=UPI0024C34F9E|nr:hypothetical protein [Cronobacter turicensis]MDK1208260.1 hypothetical protein [Cronobacter turicensis]MDK1216801.1 hypothetical protein [Cronobacter turicensis]MDK1233887.1 hypothetical protein [Cronobacter turicensis]